MSFKNKLFFYGKLFCVLCFSRSNGRDIPVVIDEPSMVRDRDTGDLVVVAGIQLFE